MVKLVGNIVFLFISCLSMDRGWLLLLIAGCCFATVIEEVVTTDNINDPLILEGEWISSMFSIHAFVYAISIHAPTCVYVYVCVHAHMYAYICVLACTLYICMHTRSKACRDLLYIKLYCSKQINIHSMHCNSTHHYMYTCLYSMTKTLEIC